MQSWLLSHAWSSFPIDILSIFLLIASYYLHHRSLLSGLFHILASCYIFTLSSLFSPSVHIDCSFNKCTNAIHISSFLVIVIHSFVTTYHSFFFISSSPLSAFSRLLASCLAHILFVFFFICLDCAHTSLHRHIFFSFGSLSLFIFLTNSLPSFHNYICWPHNSLLLLAASLIIFWPSSFPVYVFYFSHIWLVQRLLSVINIIPSLASLLHCIDIFSSAHVIVASHLPRLSLFHMKVWESSRFLPSPFRFRPFIFPLLPFTYNCLHFLHFVITIFLSSYLLLSFSYLDCLLFLFLFVILFFLRHFTHIILSLRSLLAYAFIHIAASRFSLAFTPVFSLIFRHSSIFHMSLISFLFLRSYFLLVFYSHFIIAHNRGWIRIHIVFRLASLRLSSCFLLLQEPST